MVRPHLRFDKRSDIYPDKHGTRYCPVCLNMHERRALTSARFLADFLRPTRLSGFLLSRCLSGRPWRIRTADQRIKSPLLYQLS